MAVNQSAKQPAVSAGRRLLVGTNVLIAVVLVVAIVALVQWFGATRTGRGIDMTSTGVNTLTPATERLLDDLETEIRLTSFYFETDREDEDQAKYRRAVDDLLALYAGANRSTISADWVNPLKKLSEYNEALTRLADYETYATTTNKYKEQIGSFRTEYLPRMSELVQAELDAVSALTGGLESPEAGPTEIGQVQLVLNRWMAELDAVREDVEATLALELPNYTGAVNAIRSAYSGFRNDMQAIVDFGAAVIQQKPDLPADQRQYLAGASGRYDELLAKLEQQAAELNTLPPLEVDRLVNQLGKTSNAILIEAPQLGDATVVEFADLWPPSREGVAARTASFNEREFRGEQKLTSAILRLTQRERPAVVFVRFGGTSLFTPQQPMNPMQRQPPPAYAQMRQQIVGANFDVYEWDLKATTDPPAMDPAPTRTIYVVLRPVSPPQNPFQPDPTNVPFDDSHKQALLSALGDEGRALFMTGWAPPGGFMDTVAPAYEFGEYLEETWGIGVDHEALLLNLVSIGPGKYQASRTAIVMQDVEVGDHPIVSDANARLVALPFVSPLNVATDAPAGVNLEPLMWTPESDTVWAVRDVQAFQQRLGNEFVSRTQDDETGRFAVAVAASQELEDGEKPSRKVVVVSSREWVRDSISMASTLAMKGSSISVMQVNPGNVSLLINSLHWLNDQEQLMNIGKPIESGVLQVANQATERNVQAFTIFVLPVLALLCGGVVWWIRRG